jgi:membrane-bound lytic murein transglycosylase D
MLCALLAAQTPTTSSVGDLDPPAILSSAATEPAQQPLIFAVDPNQAKDARVREALLSADRHFQSGKFFMQEDKPEEARKEFERAIDVLFLDLPESHAEFALLERKSEELGRLILRYEVERLGAGTPPESPVYVQSPLAEILEMTFPVDTRAKTTALNQVRALSSQLPLTVNDAVASYIGYFTSERGRKTFLFGMRRAERYRPMIQRILAEEGVPQEMIHLAQAESGFMPTALSRASAAGMWQFVRFRGNEYGLMQSRYHDDRLDPEKATRAAARHLRDLYNQLGDWYLAMAGYNCGPMCVERAVQRTGYADFWALSNRNVLPRETRNYVPAILAMAILAKNPEAYGLELTPGEEPLEYESITLTHATNLALVADGADRPVSDIRELNSALLRNVAPAGYELRVPKGSGDDILAALELVPGDKRLSWRLHRVTEGETLDSIARRYATAPNTILAANKRADSTAVSPAQAGEVLLIPVVERPVPVKAQPAHTTRRPAASAKSVRPAVTRQARRS